MRREEEHLTSRLLTHSLFSHLQLLLWLLFELCDAMRFDARRAIIDHSKAEAEAEARKCGYIVHFVLCAVRRESNRIECVSSEKLQVTCTVRIRERVQSAGQMQCEFSRVQLLSTT